MRALPWMAAEGRKQPKGGIMRVPTRNANLHVIRASEGDLLNQLRPMPRYYLHTCTCGQRLSLLVNETRQCTHCTRLYLVRV